MTVSKNGLFFWNNCAVIVMETAKKALQFPGLDEENSAVGCSNVCGISAPFFFFFLH